MVIWRNLATDRIYRLMIAQRVLHKVKVQDGEGKIRGAFSSPRDPHF